MPLIVDTYNVLHVVGVLPPDIAGIDTAGLADLIRLSRFRFDRVTLVCDGTPGPGAPTGAAGPVSIRYSGGGVTADEMIAQMIRRSSSPRRLTVVSSDRAIAREARRRRCATLRSEAFLRLIALDHRSAGERPTRSPRPPHRATGAGGLTDDQVDRWLSVFEISDTDDVGAFMPTEEETPPEAAPEPEPVAKQAPPRPKKEPAAPVLPLDLIAEAARMVEEARDAEAEAEADAHTDTDTDTVADTDADTDAVADAVADADADTVADTDAVADAVADADTDTVADTDADADPDTAPNRAALAALFPAELLADAEAIARSPSPPDAVPTTQPAPPSPPRPRRPDAHLPDDLLAEAEAMWREGIDDDPAPN